MSFYTSLTGLNAATAQLSVTSNNIANVGTTGFKRSRADFADIFATSPLQKTASVVGQGVALKAVTQEFSQGNIQFSANSLDIAISGDGFFPLKSADGLQDVYTRNGTFVLDDAFNVVNSTGQSLIAANVDSAGKADLDKLSKLQIPRKTSGDARETSQVQLGMNFPADAEVITAPFDRNNPATYSKTNTVTVYDANGNGYLATVYYAKTQMSTPADPTNKWQTHVYIGDTKLQEQLIQAQDNGERMFVNQYGETRRESDIPAELIARGVTKLFKVDDLRNATASAPAAANGTALDGAVLSQWTSGLRLADALSPTSEVLVPPPAADARLVFDINVDNSGTTRRIDLSSLVVPDGPKLTGIEMAREMTNAIQRAYGDERYFDVADEVGADGVLMRVKIGDGDFQDITVPESFSGRDRSKVTAGELVAAMQAGFDAASAASGLSPAPQIVVAYDPVAQQFNYTQPNSSARLQLQGLRETPGLMGLTTVPVTVDAQGSDGQTVIPNGSSLVAQADQRYGVEVRFDESQRRFVIASGSTGDTSAIRVTVPTDADVPGNEVARLLGLRTTEVDTSATPLRGVASQPAVLKGDTIGLNLENKFRVDESNNQFVVTVDNVTGVITIPPKAEYGIEEFRDALERRINAMSDRFGRSVSGVKVELKGTTSKHFEFTTGTTGDNAFIKVTANSLWGLADAGSSRGLTSTWQEPTQARDGAGFAQYVDRNGMETSDPGNYSEIEARDLWAPIYLDKGELTFDTSGKLKSPAEAVAFKSTTIGGSGATLQFSIDYAASTQYSSPFSVRKQDQNGQPEGDLIGVDIGDDGLVSASYSNGTQKSLAKIVLTNFASPTGLRQVGDSSYYATAKSGDPKTGEAGAAGFGTIRAGARERANVDLTQELVELITSQRNFQANAKAIETNNTLTQTIIQLRS